LSKRFSFSLQKLMNYKEQLLESERLVLTEMNAVLRRFREDLQRLFDEHAEKSRELNEKLVTGTTPYEIMAHKNYLSHLEELIRDKQRQISLQEQAVDRQMDKVKEAKQEISALEKLREKRYSEYSYKESKAEEQFIEEFVSNARATSEAAL
jgi:flagellar FliJ protein